ncbi:hypothetical protein H696_02072 [Fonticula alba]|uniref:Uncharacterized protein n=1 Tax=Fonticula alba TaxID=691883 RepID=A0A058ZCF9_FONAL|nr:hypothetical protein H696_02072 [Fonticula alba]KCV71122.1 hypothetical protein H696_02072 [Fonticula alba]|eukprot:XP_009494245.1 hypothetical protein H696_02072 [Fonticula alba]
MYNPNDLPQRPRARPPPGQPPHLAGAPLPGGPHHIPPGAPGHFSPDVRPAPGAVMWYAPHHAPMVRPPAGPLGADPQQAPHFRPPFGPGGDAGATPEGGHPQPAPVHWPPMAMHHPHMGPWPPARPMAMPLPPMSHLQPVAVPAHAPQSEAAADVATPTTAADSSPATAAFFSQAPSTASSSSSSSADDLGASTGGRRARTRPGKTRPEGDSPPTSARTRAPAASTTSTPAPEGRSNLLSGLFANAPATSAAGQPQPATEPAEPGNGRAPARSTGPGPRGAAPKQPATGPGGSKQPADVGPGGVEFQIRHEPLNPALSGLPRHWGIVSQAFLSLALARSSQVTPSTGKVIPLVSPCPTTGQPVPTDPALRLLTDINSSNFSWGCPNVVPGDLVSFVMIPGGPAAPGSMQVADVRLEVPRAARRYTGTISQINPNGYGFLQLKNPAEAQSPTPGPGEKSRNIYFHIQSIWTRNPAVELRIGDLLEFEIVRTDKSFSATRILLLESTSGPGVVPVTATVVRPLAAAVLREGAAPHLEPLAGALQFPLHGQLHMVPFSVGHVASAAGEATRPPVIGEQVPAQILLTPRSPAPSVVSVQFPHREQAAPALGPAARGAPAPPLPTQFALAASDMAASRHPGLLVSLDTADMLPAAGASSAAALAALAAGHFFGEVNGAAAPVPAPMVTGAAAPAPATADSPPGALVHRTLPHEGPPASPGIAGRTASAATGPLPPPKSVDIISQKPAIRGVRSADMLGWLDSRTPSAAGSTVGLFELDALQEPGHLLGVVVRSPSRAGGTGGGASSNDDLPAGPPGAGAGADDHGALGLIATTGRDPHTGAEVTALWHFTHAAITLNYFGLFYGDLVSFQPAAPPGPGGAPGVATNVRTKALTELGIYFGIVTGIRQDSGSAWIRCREFASRVFFRLSDFAGKEELRMPMAVSFLLVRHASSDRLFARRVRPVPIPLGISFIESGVVLTTPGPNARAVHTSTASRVAHIDAPFRSERVYSLPEALRPAEPTGQIRPCGSLVAGDTVDMVVAINPTTRRLQGGDVTRRLSYYADPPAEPVPAADLPANAHNSGAGAGSGSGSTNSGSASPTGSAATPAAVPSLTLRHRVVTLRTPTQPPLSHHNLMGFGKNGLGGWA